MQRIFRPRVVGPWLALALVLGLGSSAFAQTGAASITGLLTDQSGAAAPGVTVTATNQATNVPYTAISNSAGNYTITSVPVGTYIVKAELTGFKTPTTKPFHARSEADRAPRPEAGRRLARGQGRGHGGSAGAADGDGHRGRGPLRQDGRVAPAQRPLLQQPGPAAARRHRRQPAAARATRRTAAPARVPT